MTSGHDTKYILDANVFIEAYRNYYSFDICPGFWDFLLFQFENQKIYSIDWVRNELKTGDELDKWLSKNTTKKLFHKTNDTNTVSTYKKIIQWVQQSAQFNQPAKSEFAQIADGWLVAYGYAHDYTIVTREVFDEFTKKKVPIPNICREFGVNYIDTFKLIRNLNASFHYKTN